MYLIENSQNSYSIQFEIPDQINGREERMIKGALTFMPSKSLPKGSFSIKITSGLVSDDPEEKKIVLESAMEALEKSYDKLLELIQSNQDKNLKGEGGVQTHMLSELDDTVKKDRLNLGFEKEEPSQSEKAVDDEAAGSQAA